MRKRLIILLFLILPLTGCSTFGFLFDHLPFLTSWQMNRMFDLTDDQEELVEEGAERFQHWLRQDELPVIINRLKQARELWLSNQHHQAFKYFEEASDLSSKEIMAAVSLELIPFFMTMTEENAQAYRAYKSERIDDWFKSTQSKNDKAEATIERLEEWFGRLTSEQETAISELVVLVSNERQIRYDNNLQWTERFLKTALDKDQNALENWLNDPSQWWTDGARNVYENNRQQTLSVIKMILDSMTDRQKDHVTETVNDWIETLEDLI